MTRQTLYNIHCDALANGSDEVVEVSGCAVENAIATLGGMIGITFTAKQAAIYRTTVEFTLTEHRISQATRDWFSARGLKG
jgi:hypothetical protein